MKSDKRRTNDDYLFGVILEVWSEWLREWLLPIKGRKPRFHTDADSYTVVRQRIKAANTHSNPVESEYLSRERFGYMAGASINAIVSDYTEVEQNLLIGLALGASQAGLADVLGIKQQRISERIAKIKGPFVQRVLLNASVTQRMNRVYGTRVSEEPLRVRKSVTD